MLTMDSDAPLPTVSHIPAFLVRLKVTTAKEQIKGVLCFFQIFWITAKLSVRIVAKRWVTPFFAQKMAVVCSWG